MQRLTYWLAGALVAFSGAGASAQDTARNETQGTQDNPVVVELFTSQGCSSCPAADAVLSELGAMDDVIPLALHVDYWDYIGWADSFADTAFTKRQKGYARASGRRSIYTPQMMIGGTHDVIGSRPMKVMDAIDKASNVPPKARLSLERNGDMLVIRAEPLETLPATNVQMVRYKPQAKVDILDGENAGRNVTYTHIAHDWRMLGLWDGAEPLELRIAVEGSDPIVVMLQGEDYGPMFAAARLR
ncbi:DUF1223 domain-containing protein [Salipiger pallidus]|nr:DUF1223 domain-containing protein [Salipiger pallidus]